MKTWKCALLLFFMVLLASCNGGGGTDTGGETGSENISISISPTSVTLAPGGEQQFKVTVKGSENLSVTWSVIPQNGGTVDSTGKYKAPSTAGIYYVLAKSEADPSVTAQAHITVIQQGSNEQTGGNRYEGTIRISNTGSSGNSTFDQSQEIKVILTEEIDSAGIRFSNYAVPTIATANVNDTYPANEGNLTVTGSVNQANFTSATLPVYLEFNFLINTYTLFVAGVPLTATYSFPNVTISNPYSLIGREIVNQQITANGDLLIGNISVPVDDPELSFITQDISWELISYKE